MLDMTTVTHRMPNYVGPMTLVTPMQDELSRRLRAFNPRSEMGIIIKKCFGWLPPDLAQELLDTVSRCVVLSSQLEWTVHYRPDSPFRHGGPLTEYRGVVSRQKVTTAGVTALCVAWGSAAFNAIYMGLGTDSTAENKNQTGMIAEITANHYTGSVRPTCSHTESTNTVPLVGVHTHATAGDTIEEHGIFTSATQGAVTLWDRSLTGTTVLGVGDGITGTYTLTAADEA